MTTLMKLQHSISTYTAINNDIDIIYSVLLGDVNVQVEKESQISRKPYNRKPYNVCFLFNVITNGELE